MKKIINIIKKNIFGVIIGLMLGSIGVFAASKFYAKDVSVSVPTNSSLESNATLQDSLDELYSIADNNDKVDERLTNLESKKITQPLFYYTKSVSISSGTSTTVKEISLTPGVYIFYFSKSFSANANGYRRLSLSTAPDVDWGVSTSIGANQSDETITYITVPLVLNKNATLKFIVLQNSGSTLTGSMICQVIKLA